MDTNGMSKDASPSYQPQQPVYEQPTAPSQPSYTKRPEGEQEWQHGLFDCFESADNLCKTDPFQTRLDIS
jgi:hypothetical protein